MTEESKDNSQTQGKINAFFGGTGDLINHTGDYAQKTNATSIMSFSMYIFLIYAVLICALALIPGDNLPKYVAMGIVSVVLLIIFIMNLSHHKQTYILEHRREKKLKEKESSVLVNKNILAEID
ncbi:hypothetical protein GOQ27_07115 [Clostridium sp. D2Q-11]|uniref:Uncharacterized protein n=1 Tax=Anaeromonas frigoriresistens TaxID=2683708 RepID=A0A942UZ29_9FIRM|nr:hypothetical protein [Anaeromonas frigoriresistens]MBS4538227.1 hypothetical protein [Anaeromonas frigoriresistens]